MVARVKKKIISIRQRMEEIIKPEFEHLQYPKNCRILGL